MKRGSTLKRQYFLISLIWVAIFSLLVACSNDEGSGINNNNQSSEDKNNSEEVLNQEDEIDEEPALQFTDEEVVLRVSTVWGEDYFMERIGNYVEEKYDHITLEHVDWDGTTEGMEENFAENVIPDVLLATNQNALNELDMDYPLDEMLASYQIDPETDLNIPGALLDEIRSRDQEGGLIGIPQERSFYGLYYHKEVFDLFGIEHPDPEVGMSWDEVMEVARKMTTTRDGVNYCGLRFDDYTHSIPLNQMSTNLTDPETGEVLFTSDPKFTKYMELMDSYYSIPGILDESCGLAERNLGMLLSFHGFMAQTWMGGETDEEKIEIYEHIDVAPIPTWSDAPGVGPTPGGVHPWAINAYSEQKDAALQFILAGVSEEYQTILSRDGTPSILEIPEVIEQFGANNPVLDDKNTDAFFADTPASPPEVKSPYDSIVGGFPIEDFEEEEGAMDYQQFLRQAQEEAEIKIVEYEASR